MNTKKIKQALEAAIESLDAIGTPQEWDCRPLLREALSELEARKVLTDEEIEQWWGNTHRTMGHMPRTDFEMVFILRSFAGSLPPKEQGPEPVTFSTHTQRVMNKWHAVIRIGNQSFTLAAYEGSQLEANCYADKAMEAFRRLVVPTAREKAMEEAIRILQGSLEAASLEGIVAAVQRGDTSTFLDIWDRRIVQGDAQARARLAAKATK